MKNKFACFYDVQNDDDLKGIWESNNTLFVFDTNVLLSLYSFETDSRNDFFMVLSKIEPRIWIPFHVCLEFQLRRIEVIKNRRDSFEKLKKEMDKLKDVISFDKKFFSALQSEFSLQKKYPDAHKELEKVQSILSNKFSELENEIKSHITNLKNTVEEIDKEKLFINSEDFIRSEIDNHFKDERIGDNFFKKQEDIDIFNDKGNERYNNYIPPGYKDAETKGDSELHFDGLRYKRKFGDLIIFKQMIKHAKEKNIKNIVFISEDVKEDWRQIENSNGKKILGARVELKREMYSEADVSNFIIYNIEDFMKLTNKYLKVDIKSDTIINIKKSLAKAADDSKCNQEKLTTRTRIDSKKIQRFLEIAERELNLNKTHKETEIKENCKNNNLFEHNKYSNKDWWNVMFDNEFNKCLLNENHKNTLSSHFDFSKESLDSAENVGKEAMRLINYLNGFLFVAKSDEMKIKISGYKDRLTKILNRYNEDPNIHNITELKLECDEIRTFIENN
ncbi:PIN-like domain-containing protein [Providencia manganoxydans]|uniref:PIN-like domain-containing protein n=1 Tax=Providencia manganoxydans TaxID=2923283 RepID=UPI0034E3A87A